MKAIILKNEEYELLSVQSQTEIQNIINSRKHTVDSLQSRISNLRYQHIVWNGHEGTIEKQHNYFLEFVQWEEVNKRGTRTIISLEQSFRVTVLEYNADTKKWDNLVTNIIDPSTLDQIISFMEAAEKETDGHESDNLYIEALTYL